MTFWIWPLLIITPVIGIIVVELAYKWLEDRFG